MPENYPDKNDQELIKAIASLKSEKEVQSFLRDLLTLQEIKAASQRFQIAKLLWITDLSYKEIAKNVKTSTTTVTRVADWLYKKGFNGYQSTLKRLFPKND